MIITIISIDVELMGYYIIVKTFTRNIWIVRLLIAARICLSIHMNYTIFFDKSDNQSLAAEFSS
jgi:hypothetical protein